MKSRPAWSVLEAHQFEANTHGLTANVWRYMKRFDGRILKNINTTGGSDVSHSGLFGGTLRCRSLAKIVVLGSVIRLLWLLHLCLASDIPWQERKHRKRRLKWLEICHIKMLKHFIWCRCSFRMFKTQEFRRQQVQCSGGIESCPSTALALCVFRIREHTAKLVAVRRLRSHQKD